MRRTSDYCQDHGAANNLGCGSGACQCVRYECSVGCRAPLHASMLLRGREQDPLKQEGLSVGLLSRVLTRSIVAHGAERER